VPPPIFGRQRREGGDGFVGPFAIARLLAESGRRQGHSFKMRPRERERGVTGWGTRRDRGSGLALEVVVEGAVTACRREEQDA